MDGGYNPNNGPLGRAVIEITVSQTEHMLQNLMETPPNQVDQCHLDEVVTTLAEAKSLLLRFTD